MFVLFFQLKYRNIELTVLSFDQNYKRVFTRHKHSNKFPIKLFEFKNSLILQYNIKSKIKSFNNNVKHGQLTIKKM